jgi:predicted NAD/FAD-dependent oxidoreductase
VTDGRSVKGVRTRDEIVDTDTVIVAVPWHAFRQVWDGGVPDGVGTIAEHASAMRSSPIVTTNLWFDGPVMTVPFVGLVDGTMHWAFDKGALFHRGARHLSLVSSGAHALADRENADITTVALADLSRALPESRSRRLIRSLVVREQRATFSLAPGGPERPSPNTAVAGCYLAGDWTNTGLPATIEGAVMSGRRAAEAVMADGKRRGS